MDKQFTRREFLTATAAGAASFALASTGILAPARALGANDRLRVGVIGAGDRMGTLMKQFHELQADLNCELTAVCDIWTVNRDKAVKTITDWYGAKPIIFDHYKDMLASKDIDAVMIGTADFQHAMMLRDAILAGKHAYCEKPTANTLEDANALIKTAEAYPNVFCQVGTQRRSDGTYYAARDFLKSGALGTLSRVECRYNYYGARWQRKYDNVKSEDVDWQQFLMGKAHKDFDPRTFREWRLFRPFSTGIPCQWMSHINDGIHIVTDSAFPKSCVAMSGVFNWKDGRQNGDVFQAIYEYPEGFIFNYSTGFGNGADNDFSFYGTNGWLNGDPDKGGWVATGDGGGDQKIKEKIEIKPQQMGGHMRNWVESVRTGKQPNATVMHGYQHAIANIMAVRAYDTGRRQVFDPAKRTISEG